MLLLSWTAEIARVQSQANMEHLNEFKQLRTEMEALSALALEGQAHELLLLHAIALRESKAELQASYSSEIVRVESEANRQYSNGIGSVRKISGKSVIAHFVYSSKEYQDTILGVHFKSVVIGGPQKLLFFNHESQKKQKSKVPRHSLLFQAKKATSSNSLPPQNCQICNAPSFPPLYALSPPCAKESINWPT